jgi:hypothetical protein
MLYERLTILISGYFGIIFILLSFFQLRKIKEWLFFVAFFVSSALYVTVFATGNVQHDYYQILIMPSVAIAFALGAIIFHDEIKNSSCIFGDPLYL